MLDAHMTPIHLACAGHPGKYYKVIKLCDAESDYYASAPIVRDSFSRLVKGGAKGHSNISND